MRSVEELDQVASIQGDGGVIEHIASVGSNAIGRDILEIGLGHWFVESTVAHLGDRGFIIPSIFGLLHLGRCGMQRYFLIGPRAISVVDPEHNELSLCGRKSE